MDAHDHPAGDELPPVARLALVYAPSALQPLWAGFFALDTRLARAAQPGEQPMLAQVRLAWWRDRLRDEAAAWPRGEPLLAMLAPWDAERQALAGLVDGWEAREIGEDDGVALRAARVEALLALARLAGAGDPPDAVRRAALDWQDGEAGGRAPRLSRAMRPLAVLRALALRGEAAPPWSRMLAGVRAGLLGR